MTVIKADPLLKQIMERLPPNVAFSTDIRLTKGNCELFGYQALQVTRCQKKTGKLLKIQRNTERRENEFR